MSDVKKPSHRNSPVAPWQVLESKYTYQDRWLRLRTETVKLPNDHVLAHYHIIEYPTWVAVIAITPEQNIVLTEEYRHGAVRTITELPCGMANDAEETAAAMKRELLEETGYSGGNWQALGSFFANPARQTNRVHAFLAIDVRRTAEPTLDAGEVIQTHEMPWAEFIAEVSAGSLELPAFNLAGLALLQLQARKSTDPRVRRLTL